MKAFGWLLYLLGFVVWIVSLFITGHAPLFGWPASTPKWIAALIPNLEAEFGMGIMIAAVIPICWPAREDKS